MENATSYSFQSQAVDENTFTVLRFTGREALSATYEFDITLGSTDADIDLDAMLANEASFAMQSDRSYDYYGILAEVEQLHAFEGWYFYRVLLVPRLWRFKLARGCEAHLDAALPELIKNILRDGGLGSRDFELRLSVQDYPTRPICCQFNETRYDFLLRLLQRDGLYYYFEQHEDFEKLIITDNRIAHQDLPGPAQLQFNEAYGTIAPQGSLSDFRQVMHAAPEQVRLRDYNYRTPSLELDQQASVSANGVGTMYHYGDHFVTEHEGERLAHVRAEQHLSEEEQYHGTYAWPGLTPGYTVTLSGHGQDEYNQGYLITELEHRGAQSTHFVQGLWPGTPDSPGQPDSTDGEDDASLTPGHATRFTARPAAKQYRPVRDIPHPTITGSMNAVIDGSQSDTYPELDGQGRYKVRLPFDLKNHQPGKASPWLRMAQPYGGDACGLHFPLHKGTEALLTFVGGNPDRPIISAAVPNPLTPSPVTSENKTRAGFHSKGGNTIYADDTTGHEHMVLKGGGGSSLLRVGANEEKAVSSQSNWMSLAAGGAGALFTIYTMSNIALRSQISITGLKWALATTSLRTWIKNESPELFSELSSNHENVALILEGIIQAKMELIQLTTQLAYEEELGRQLYTAPGYGEIEFEPAFAVYSKGSGKSGTTYAFTRAGGKDIIFSTDQGSITMYSQKNAIVCTEGRATYSGGTSASLTSANGSAVLQAKTITVEQEVDWGKRACITMDGRGDITIEHAGEDEEDLGLITMSSKNSVKFIINNAAGKHTVEINDYKIDIRSQDPGGKINLLLSNAENGASEKFFELQKGSIKARHSKILLQGGEEGAPYSFANGEFKLVDAVRGSDQGLDVIADRINIGS